MCERSLLTRQRILQWTASGKIKPAHNQKLSGRLCPLDRGGAACCAIQRTLLARLILIWPHWCLEDSICLVERQESNAE